MQNNRSKIIWGVLVSGSLLPLNNVIAEEQRTKENKIEQIVVVGEKAARTLKETLSSVSVVGEDELNSMQNQTVRDAISGIANVVNLTGAVPDIRGVTGNGAAGGFNSVSGGSRSRVSMLVDGVLEPFVADFTGDSGLWDVEQIEVYRGPQSTNNGQNSIAGSMYIKTKNPEFDWGGAVRLGYRDQDQFVDTSAVVTGPLSDSVAFRVSAQLINGQSYVNDEGFATNPAPYDLNEIETNRLRGKLLWEPNEKLSVLFKYATNDEEGETGRRFFVNDGSSEFNRLFYRDIDTNSKTSSVKLDYQVNQEVSVDVLLAHMDYQWGFDSYEANPLAQQNLVFDDSNLTLDARVNYESSSNSLSGFLGVAFYDREQDINSLGSIAYLGDDESSSKALYGELSYGLNDKLSMIVGARLQNEEQKRDFNYPPIAATLDQDTTVTLPKLAFQYSLSESTLLFASVRKGYNAAGGALNFAAQEYYYFDEEEVTTYEVGFRKSSKDAKLNVNANAFYNVYDGYQAVSTSRFIVNMEEAVTYGLEIEAAAYLLENLALKASVGLLSSEIKEAGEEYSDATGNELNSAPSITASLRARYQFSDAVDLGLSVNYVDEYYGDFLNTEARIAGGYTLAKMKLNYEVNNWLFAFSVNNLFDDDSTITEEPAGRRYPLGYYAIVEPRNIGVSLTYSF